jgi:Spy/CpxP family protein refolding chaperone
MKNRVLSLAAMLVLGTASVAVAQQPPQGPPAGGQGPGPNRGAQRMQIMMQGITLTPAQQTQVDSIMARYQAQMPAMTPGQRPDSAQMAQRREMTQHRDTDIRAVLTSDQQKIWDNNLSQMRANMPQRP